MVIQSTLVALQAEPCAMLNIVQKVQEYDATMLNSSTTVGLQKPTELLI